MLPGVSKEVEEVLGVVHLKQHLCEHFMGELCGRGNAGLGEWYGEDRTHNDIA